MFLFPVLVRSACQTRLESTCSSTSEWELSDLRSINNDKSRRYSGLVLSETSLHTHTGADPQTHNHSVLERAGVGVWALTVPSLRQQ